MGVVPCRWLCTGSKPVLDAFQMQEWMLTPSLAVLMLCNVCDNLGLGDKLSHTPVQQKFSGYKSGAVLQYP